MKFTFLTKTDPFEKRLFEIVSLILAAFTIYGSVENVMIEGRVLTRTITLVLLVYAVVSYLLSRFGYFSKRLIVVTVSLIYVVVVFFWFWISGAAGPIGIALVTIISISFIFGKGAHLKSLFYFNIGLTTFLCIFQYFRPDLILYGDLPYPTIPLEFLVVSYLQIILIYYLRREVEEERRVSKLKNEQLTVLNENLKATVETQKDTLDKLYSTQTQLVESEKMASLGKLTAGLAHEIKNPLNYVGGVVTPLKIDIKELIDMIPEDKRSDAVEISKEIDELLKSVESGTKLASDIMIKLQNVSRKEDHLGYAAIDIPVLVRDVIALVEKSSLGITFKSQLQTGLYIEGNAIEINQVVLNLLRNSVQAIPSDRDGIIEVSVEESAGNVEIRISDNGVGMSKETMDHAFEAFYSTKSGDGTGLGLFISMGIIQSHNGTIDVDSEVGKGSTFKLIFPKFSKT